VHVNISLNPATPAAVQLHDRLMAELDDQPIPGTNLYYFVGTMGVNWGKAGSIRISGHTRPRARIATSSTCGVLHIEK
jgi:hypothetical protein